MQDRLNGMESSAIVIMMQRTNEEYISGAILSVEMDYDHLMITMAPGLTLSHCDWLEGSPPARWRAGLAGAVSGSRLRALARDYVHTPMPANINSRRCPAAAEPPVVACLGLKLLGIFA